ncbi:MAG: type II toxin-antitoxin system HipA family toxin YjjJ [Methylococcaceae bacterium]
MSSYSESIRSALSAGLISSKQLAEKFNVSQPTVSRGIAELNNEVVKIGSARSIQYALRDNQRGLPEIPVYRVSSEGTLKKLGTLIPVRPEGFVMCHEDGKTTHSDSIPWWLFDMIPQGFLGRAYAMRHATALGLPADIKKWNDSEALRALLAHGYDVIGNLLLGDVAREHFINAAEPRVSSPDDYVQLAYEAASGENPGSSAGGEQPKFTAYNGKKHVIVKFSDFDDNPVSERWRDLLFAEHLALETLREAGILAAKTTVFDIGTQRFLEVERFDRIGKFGRRAVCSLKAFDAEFVGKATESWSVIAQHLVSEKQINAEAVKMTSHLQAFGTLIGNTDMHNGNLSFISDEGCHFSVSPAYDMTSMAFAPRSGGGLPNSLSAPAISACVDSRIWQFALNLACTFLTKIKTHSESFSPRFKPCISALEQHIENGAAKIAKLE